MKSYIIAAILRLLPHPSPGWHESQADYETRVDTVAEAIVAETKDPALQMAVVVTIINESNLDPAVHAGTKLGDHGAAICLGQQHQLWRTKDEWLALAGTDFEHTRRCIKETARGLRGALGVCRRRNSKADYADAFVLYGTGRTCDPREGSAAAHFGRRAKQWYALAGG